MSAWLQAKLMAYYHIRDYEDQEKHFQLLEAAATGAIKMR